MILSNNKYDANIWSYVNKNFKVIIPGDGAGLQIFL